MKSTATTLACYLWLVISLTSLADDVSPGPTGGQESRSGSITKIALGRVVDARCEPIAGAMVIYDEMADLSSEATTTTDEAGNFRLQYRPGEEATSAKLWAYSPKHCIRCVSLYDRQKEDIVLPDNHETTVQVIEPNGNPLSNATVEPYYFELPNGVFASDKSTGLSGFIPPLLLAKLCSTTDGQGKFTLRNLPPELLKSLRVTHDSYGAQGAKPGSEIRLREVGSVTVRIPKQDAAKFANVSLSTTNGEWSLVAVAQGEFDSDGVCTIPAIAAGTLSISMKFDKTSEKQPWIPDDLRVVAGQATPINIELRDTIPVSGRIIAGDEGVLGAKIWIRSLGMNPQTVISNEEGAYHARVFPGDIDLQLFVLSDAVQRKYNYPPSIKGTVGADDNTFTVDDFVLPEQKFITGKVIDAHDKPVAYRYVAAIATEPYGFPAFAGTLDENGNFEAILQNEGWKDFGRIDYLLFPNAISARSANRDELPRLKIISVDPLVLRVTGELPQ
jgi:hypothetical protein